MTRHQYPQDVEGLFLAALEQATPLERAAYVEEACAGNQGLLVRVRELLDAHEEDVGPLDLARPGVRGTIPPPGNSEVPDSRVGPYQLLEQIGEGGMGVVWRAEQQEPVHRLVALKLLKPGMDSHAVLARFEAERQALALMDHPHIAKVHDAGTTESGRPYFVMELVQGVPITRFCDDQRLTPHQRLELFVPVCQALQHAHTKGTIHRDVKPSNVLVACYDGVPVVKVIDFGIAKAVGGRLTEQTLVTGLGQVLGTLEYMSPEQAEFNALDIDTRSDIYSLGVLLYELLTGSTPLEPERLRETPLSELLRLIREEEAPRPSTKLSRAATLPGIAAARQTEPGKLTKLLRGELDWIVLKALAKDRNRRYETANSLARDVGRYLNDEPVEACPPSVAYRLGKFLRRYKGPVLAAALVLLALLGGVLGTVWGLVRARQALGAEAKQREQAEQAEALARQRLDEVTAERAVAAALNDFLRRDLLLQADVANQPFGAGLPERNPQVTVRELLDRSAATVAGRFADQPLTEAAIRLTLAETYHGLGEFTVARPHAERAVALYTAQRGAGHPDTLNAKNRLAMLCHDQADYERVEQLCREVLHAQTAQPGADDPHTLRAKTSLADLYFVQRKYDQAEVLCREVLHAQTARLGGDHPDTLTSKHNLATLYIGQNKFADSEPLLREVVHARTAQQGADHFGTLLSKNSLAGLYWRMGRLEESVALFEELLRTLERTLGADHPLTIRGAYNLAVNYRDAGRLAEAEALMDDWLPRGQGKLGLGHSLTQFGMQTALRIYERQKKPAKIEALLRAQADYLKEQAGADAPAYAAHLALLAQNLLNQRKFADAEPVLRACLAVRAQKEPHVWTTFLTQARLGISLLGQKKYAEAEPLLVQGYEGLKQRQDKLPPYVSLTEVLEPLVHLYNATGQKDKAAAWRRQLEEAKAAAPKPKP